MVRSGARDDGMLLGAGSPPRGTAVEPPQRGCSGARITGSGARLPGPGSYAGARFGSYDGTGAERGAEGYRWSGMPSWRSTGGVRAGALIPPGAASLRLGTARIRSGEGAAGVLASGARRTAPDGTRWLEGASVPPGARRDGAADGARPLGGGASAAPGARLIAEDDERSVDDGAGCKSFDGTARREGTVRSPGAASGTDRPPLRGIAAARGSRAGVGNPGPVNGTPAEPRLRNASRSPGAGAVCEPERGTA